MPPLLDRKLRFSDVVFAIDMSPKALRLWLQRDQVELVSDAPDDGGWRHFCIADVAVLSLTRALVNFGLQVENASNLARHILVGMQGVQWLDLQEPTPDSLSLFWTNRAVLIAWDDDSKVWDLKIWDMWQPFPADFAPSCIIVRPETILRRAIRRAITGTDETTLEHEEAAELLEALKRLTRTIQDATPKGRAED